MVVDPNTTKITSEQAALIAAWLEANAKAPGWLDGYALGGSYIDTRIKEGSKSDGRQAYVDIDHATAKAVPQLSGHRATDIRDYLTSREAFNAEEPAVETLDVKEGDIVLYRRIGATLGLLQKRVNMSDS